MNVDRSIYCVLYVFAFRSALVVSKNIDFIRNKVLIHYDRIHGLVRAPDTNDHKSDLREGMNTTIDFRFSIRGKQNNNNSSCIIIKNVLLLL